MNNRDLVAITVGDTSLNLGAVLAVAKFRDQFSWLREAIENEIIRREAESNGVAVSREEVDQSAHAFRVERKLRTAVAMNDWLASRSLSVRAWHAMLKADLLRQKITEQVVGEEDLRYFVEHRLEFDSAILSVIIVAEEGLCRELGAQIREDGVDFQSLARQYSTDAKAKVEGGYKGRMWRPQLAPLVQAAVFSAVPGQVVGPIKVDRDWHLIQVGQVYPAELEEQIRANIRKHLFDTWLANQQSQLTVACPLLDLDIEGDF